MSCRRSLPLSLVLTAFCLNGVAHADCGAPELLVEPTAAAPGAAVVVTGRALREPGVCRDAGCGLRRGAGPAKNVRVVLVTADSEEVRLGVLPDEGYDRVREVRLPSGLRSGSATIQAVRNDGAVLASVPVEVLPER